MESSSSSSRSEVAVASTVVDPFLVEALRSPRHRLAVLRMELDIQKFLQNPDVLEFEFSQLPNSYHRLAAHRVAQHYGLQTIVLDDAADCLGTKILVMRTAESKYPSVKLSDILARQPDDKPGQIKIATRPRLSRSSSEASKIGAGNTMRTVEERIEEYERARARIFSSQGSFRVDDSQSLGLPDGNSISLSKEASGSCKQAVTDSENIRDLGSSSRVAIFKDTEKDRSDPDYDRSYDRYARNFPVGHGTAPKYQPSFIQYGTAFSQSAQISGSQYFLNYGTSSDPTMTHFSLMGLNQAPSDAMYVQWPSPAVMYAHSYEQLKHTVLQVPFCQQALSFDYSQNY
ncbi:R3H domain-containing protein [Drosera capensis]